jgi:hypothetical protein
MFTRTFWRPPWGLGKTIPGPQVSSRSWELNCLDLITFVWNNRELSQVTTQNLDNSLSSRNTLSIRKHNTISTNLFKGIKHNQVKQYFTTLLDRTRFSRPNTRRPNKQSRRFKFYIGGKDGTWATCMKVGSPPRHGQLVQEEKTTHYLQHHHMISTKQRLERR